MNWACCGADRQAGLPRRTAIANIRVGILVTAIASVVAASGDSDASRLADTTSRIDVATLVARLDPATVMDLAATEASMRDPPQRVALPVRLQRVAGNLPGVFWFDIALPPRAAMPAEPALFLPRLTDGGSFYLNGEPVFSVPGADALRRVRWRRARSIVLPVPALRDEGNVLNAKIVSRDFIVDFPFMLLGPAAELQAEAQARQWVDQYGSQFSGITAVVVGSFILGIWWFRRGERYYLWFGLSSLLWALRTINYSIEVVPTNLWWWWRAGQFLTIAAATATLIGFFCSFAGLRWRRTGRVVLVHALAGPILVVASDGRWHEAVHVWWQALLFPGIGVAVARFAWWGYRQRSQEALVITVGVLLAVGLAANDYATISGLFEHTRVYTLHLALPVLLLTIGILLTMRFVAALRATEEANQVLEQRLAERERELATQYGRIGEIERREARAGERHRIMQDMHDGLGAQLISSLALVEGGATPPAEVVLLLRESLDELRIAIDAFGDDDVNLQNALASLRHRMEPRLLAAGILLEWTVNDRFARVQLDDHATMQVLHIVQEALANAIRHSRATLVQVDLQADERACRIVVADNGGGPGTARGGPEVPGDQPFQGGEQGLAWVIRGRGLSGIRKRAHSLGGDADIAIGPQRTVICVTWPVPRLPGVGQLIDSSADPVANRP